MAFKMKSNCFKIKIPNLLFDCFIVPSYSHFIVCYKFVNSQEEYDVDSFRVCMDPIGWE